MLKISGPALLIEEKERGMHFHSSQKINPVWSFSTVFTFICVEALQEMNNSQQEDVCLWADVRRTLQTVFSR